MSTSDRISALLLAIYDAATDESAWPGVLEELASLFRAHQTVFDIYDVKAGAGSLPIATRIEDVFRKEYQDYFATRNVWAIAGRHLMVPGAVVTGEMMLPNNELVKSEYYNGFLRPQKMFHLLAAAIDRDLDRAQLFSCLRPQSKSPFGSSETVLLTSLIPHLRKAFFVRRQLFDLKNRGDGFEAALELLAQGVVLLDDRCEIVFANRAAEKLFSLQDGLIISRKHISAEVISESAQLGKLIREAIQVVPGKVVENASVLAVTRRKLPQLRLLVSPLRMTPAILSKSVRVVIFINDPANDVRPNDQTLQVLFGLTSAERRLATLLCDGHAPPQIAEILGVSRNTLKSQLASIYRKTGTSRQAQLVHLLLQMSSPR